MTLHILVNVIVWTALGGVVALVVQKMHKRSEKKPMATYVKKVRK